MFKAILIDKQDGTQSVRIADVEESKLPDAQVTVRVEYSTINYKDGLAITGKSPVVRKFPMVPGIDLAGVVEASTSEAWRAGERVLLNGWGVGEGHWGGLAQEARLKAEWLQRVPAAFTARQAMAIGTAGYTASLCVEALVRQGLKPEQGEVLVTGASGGVGSVAVALLARAGFNVVASTGKASAAAYLQELGARQVIDRNELAQAGKPLQKERWSGVVDSVGSHARQRLCANALSGCGCRVRPGTGNGFSRERRTLHFARCCAARNRQRHGADGGPRARMGSPCARLGRVETGSDQHRGWPRGRVECRARHRRGENPRARRCRRESLGELTGRHRGTRRPPDESSTPRILAMG